MNSNCFLSLMNTSTSSTFVVPWHLSTLLVLLTNWSTWMVGWCYRNCFLTLMNTSASTSTTLVTWHLTLVVLLTSWSSTWMTGRTVLEENTFGDAGFFSLK
eukprot:TRINITY_DN33731_c0_g1_i1.p1 TRINITY_DN33731_c0_g1~~TRINITY_DN33731_c0_g1_i1.p1  ORF type:complete len:101 (+),score=23.67 TRINITY_DN33731_c0_g1_i1:53-355(+)